MRPQPSPEAARGSGAPHPPTSLRGFLCDSTFQVNSPPEVRRSAVASLEKFGITDLATFSLVGEEELAALWHPPGGQPPRVDPARLFAFMARRLAVQAGSGPGSALQGSATSGPPPDFYAHLLERLAPSKYTSDTGPPALASGRVFNLAQNLRDRGVTFLGSSWFADSARLAELAHDIDGHLKTRSAVFVSSSLDKWVPPWVGRGLPFAEHKTLLAARLSNSSCPVRLFSNITSLLLSYLAVAHLPPEALLGHLTILFQIFEEAPDGVSPTARVRAYWDFVQASIVERARQGSSLDIPSLLAKLDGQALDLADRKIRSSRRPSPISRPPRLPPRTNVKKEKSPRQSQAASQSKAPPPRRPWVCLDHDPANGASCPALPSCTREHLDTKDPAAAQRFLRAKAAAARVRARPLAAAVP